MKRRLIVLGFILIITGALGSIWLAHAQATITVNTFVDAVGTCPATCTLRAAILAANSGDTIEFSGSGTIEVNASGGLGELPSLSAGGVTIDPGANQIVLDGSQSPNTDPPLAYGLRINSDDNVILGLEILGFAGDGIFIDGGDGNRIGGTGANDANLIHLNGGNGVVLDNAGSLNSPNVIEGNLIGTDAIGTSVEANGGVGILLRNESNFNLIGGGSANTANIISGNTSGGIRINNSSDNTVEGNRIGLDGGTGVSGLGNGGVGVRIENGSSNNSITNNAISDNAGDGVSIGSSDDNTVSGNRIGIDAPFGFVGLGNSGAGIRVQNSTGTSINGNSIADNNQGGVLLIGGSNTSVIANRIGVGANGTTALANTGDGVQISGSNNNTLNANTIAANSGDGGEINGGTGNTISNNRIGLNQSLGASGNGGNGVFIANGTGTTISSNNVGNNAGDGVLVSAGGGNAIRSNIMLNNGGLGIDLGANGVTANDNGDGDSGPNALQNFPVITAALFDGVATTRITGTLNSTPNTTFTLEFFANTVCDPSNHGEAETVLATTINVTVGGGGNASFVADVGGLAVGDFVTATAIRPNGSTSEFALCEEVVQGPPIADFSANPTSGNAPLTVNFTNQSTGLINSYLWDFGDGNTSTLQNPTHVFTAPGTYMVELTVIGPGGSDTATLTITVTAPGSNTQPPPTSPPSITFVPSATPAASLTPSVTASLTPTLPPTATFTPSATFTLTSTLTHTPSSTPTLTASPTFTLTPSATRTATATLTRTSTPTLTHTFTPTFTVTASLTPTFTASPLPTLTPTATPSPDLGVTKVAEAGSLRVIVDNAGDTDANNVGLIEALRPGVRYISSRPGAPICVEDAGIVYCALGRIAGGSSAEVDFDVSTDGTDPTSGRTIITSDGVQLIVIDEPYLLKIGEPPVAGPGATVTYTLRVINPTSEAAFQIRVEDRMPDTLIIESASASSGTVSIQGQSITYNLDRLEAGGRATITIMARVRQSDMGADEILNRACLTSQSNRVPSCAEMRFVRAGELPGTGEQPLVRWLVAVTLVAFGIGFVARLAIRRR